MRLTDLYARVTEAIARAEALEAQEQHRDATIAYHEVSRIEEQIARHLPASDPEGALARQGVVTAALSAGDWPRAAERARAYAAEEGLPDSFRIELEALRREAEERLRRLQGSDEPLVVPVRFKIVPGAA